MYLQHFSLTELPFGLTPDTQFFCGLTTHQSALNVLLLALRSGEGFIKITGPVGTGKTLLCRKLLNELDERFPTAYIPNPNLPPEGLRMAIADEFGLPYSDGAHQSRELKQIQDYLISAAKNGKCPVLIIDEAQGMSLETLEALRMLTNLETEKQKLLQIVLFAQPELDELLTLQAIRQLRQRITFSYRLEPLGSRDVAIYIRHRLAVAGRKDPTIFTKPALWALHHYSRGVPRLVNILAHKALLASFGQGEAQAGLKQVRCAAIDTEDTRHRVKIPRLNKAYLLLIFGGISLLLWQYRDFWI